MAQIKVEKKFVEGHKTLFLVSMILIILSLIITAVFTKHYLHPLFHWVLVIVLSIALLVFTYYFSYRDDTATLGNSRKDIPKGFMIGAWFFYVLVVLASATSARTNSVEDCWPKKPLADAQGNIPDADAYIDFFKDRSCSRILLDEPAQDYIRTNHKLPYWIMTPDGYTSDVIGWINYYSNHPQNPYDLKSMTAEERQGFYDSRKLPSRILFKEK